MEVLNVIRQVPLYITVKPRRYEDLGTKAKKHSHKGVFTSLRSSYNVKDTNGTGKSCSN